MSAYLPNSEIDRNRYNRRKALGYSASELPVCLYVLFFLLLIPLLSLSTLLFRAGACYVGVRIIASKAARAMSFDVDRDNVPSATKIARQTENELKSLPLAGAPLKDADLQVSILTVPRASSSAVTRSTSVLSSVNLKDNRYMIEISLVSRIKPLMPCSQALFGSVPGLSKDIVVRQSVCEVCEHPSGLTL